MAETKFSTRQSVNRSALPMVGSAANEGLHLILGKIDPELSKLFEDRNILLQDGGIITYTGTTLQFTEALKLSINQKVAGGSPVVIDLGSSDRTLSATGRMLYAVINRTAGTAVVTDDATTLPAAASANQEVFLIAKRVDAADGTQRVYFRSGMALNAGQSVRLGSSGSGSGGSGTGDDLNALLFKASFTDGFDEIPNASGAVDIGAGKTDSSLFSATNGYFRLAYDASKTVTGTGTSMTLSATPGFTVKVGDILVVGSEARRITAVASQTSYTIEAAFTTDPSAAAANVSQAVYTKDLNNYAGDGLAIASAFSDSFSVILVDYEDTSAADDKIFDANVAPVIGYTASSDGTNYTEVKVRETNLDDERQVVTLPTAGTNLYIRFFANKSSGSGFVNILKYKAFLHKGEAAEDGDSLDTAYCFTNGTGTEINCNSPVVVSGKTRLTLGFNYAVGVNPGTTNGSLEVYLNGQKLPRFVDSTLTPDSSYKEISANTIELDDDYSAYNLSLEVVRRVAVIDGSDTNTTNISALQNSMNIGFQGFVDSSNLLTATSTAGTPAAGKFYSSITNRSAIVDLSQDLKPKMGVERIAVQQIYQIYNELGPNNEPVWGALNDTNGLIRYVGNWSWLIDGYGNRVVSSTVDDYIEVTFYGTGLNALIFTDSSARDIRSSVNGGSEGSNLYPSSASGVLGDRSYSANIVINMVSNLTLGVHTVKIRNNSSFTNTSFYGFEILNPSSTIKVSPGSAYVAGKKLVLAAESAIAYNSSFDSGVLGVRGGRVVVYQKADGTIGKALQPVDAAQANMSLASHANEEVARVYNWREFGAFRGAGDDFSLVTPSAGDKHFTLDDGTTSLVGNNIGQAPQVTVVDAGQMTSPGAFFLFTFIGTGLDLVSYGDVNNVSDSHSFIIDGVTLGSLTTTSVANKRYYTKVVSGLPYGTHTFKLLRNAASTGSAFNPLEFIVYQPKKPSIPTGAIELADYNIMADFVANTTSGLDTIATGVLRKYANREFTYVNGSGGSTDWSGSAVNVEGSIGGRVFSTNRANAYVEYTFFGTGFDYRFQSNTSLSTSVQFSAQSLSTGGSLLALNTTNFPSIVTSVHGGVSYNASTGVANLNASGTNGSGIRVSGLPLAVYKLRILTNNAQDLPNEAIDFITPIHSHKANLYGDLQSTLPVGSNALSDNRQSSPLKNSHKPRLAWAQAVGVTGSPTTTSTAYVPMPDMSVQIKTSGGPVEIIGTVVGHEGDNGFAMAIYVDGKEVQKLEASPTTIAQHRAITKIVPLAAGTHKVDLYWRDASGGGNAASLVSTYRVLTVKELPNG
jgi:hypothetical protein